MTETIINAVVDDRGSRRFLATMFVVGLGGGMTASFVAVLAADLGASYLIAAVVAASSSIALVLVDLFGTRLIPHLDARLAIAAGCAIFGLGSAVAAVAPGVVFVWAGRALQGAGSALFMGASLQLAVRLAPYRRRPHAISSYNAVWFGGISLGLLLGALLSHVAQGIAGLRVTFAVCAGMNLLGSVAALVLLPRREPPTDGDADQEPARLGLPRLGFMTSTLRWTLVLAGACQGLRAGVSLTLVPLFATRSLRLSALGVGLVASVLATADIAAMRTAAAASERLGNATALALALIIGAIGAAVTAADPTVTGLVVACLLMGVAVGAAWVVPVAMVVHAAPDVRAALAAFRIVSDVGMLLGAIAAGALLGIQPGAAAFQWTAGALAVLAVATVAAGRLRDPGLSASGYASAPVRLLTASSEPGQAVHVAALRPSPTSHRTGESAMASEPTQPTRALIEEWAAYQGLEYGAPRLDYAREFHARIHPLVLQLRAVPLSFTEPVLEPASALAWLENGGLA